MRNYLGDAFAEHAQIGYGLFGVEKPSKALIWDDIIFKAGDKAVHLRPPEKIVMCELIRAEGNLVTARALDDTLTALALRHSIRAQRAQGLIPPLTQTRIDNNVISLLSRVRGSLREAFGKEEAAMFCTQIQTHVVRLPLTGQKIRAFRIAG